MKFLTKTIAAAALAGTAAIATPAAAQVAGIATSSPEAVIVQANPGVVQQIQQKEQQLGQASQPIVLAQTYAIEQLINDYQNVRQQVVQQKNIQLLLTPDAIQWAPEAVNVTDDLVAVLDQRVPTVQITPPEGWRPRQDSLAAQQTVSQVLMNVAQQQAAQQQAQQQQPAAQPAGR